LRCIQSLSDPGLIDFVDHRVGTMHLRYRESHDVAEVIFEQTHLQGWFAARSRSDYDFDRFGPLRTA